MNIVNKILNNFITSTSILIYNFTIITFGLYLIITHRTHFPPQVYAISTIGYIILIIFLKKNFLKTNTVGYGLSIAYITISLYNADIPHIPATIYLLLPITSAQYCAHKIKHMFYINIFTTLSYWIVFGTYQIIPFIAFQTILTALGFLHFSSHYLSNINDNISATIDQIFTNNIRLGNTHELYDLFKEVASKFRIFGDIKINDIYCFKLINNEYIFISSSNPKSKVNISKEQTICISEKHKTKKAFTKEYINIDDVANGNNVFIPLTQNKEEFILIFNLKRQCPLFILHILSAHQIHTIFLKILRAIVLEERLRQENNNLIQEAREYYQYIGTARQAMHYLRNKFTPIKNLIEMSLDESLDRNNELVQYYMHAEVKQANRSMNSILQMSSRFLEKKYFDFEPDTKLSLKAVQVKLKQHWIEQINNNDLHFLIQEDNIKDKYIIINNLGFEILLADILANMKKYAGKNRSVETYLENNRLLIIFKNNFTGNSEKLKKLAKSFMSDEAYEIEQRKTLGLRLMKDCMKTMQINYQVAVDKDFFIFSLQIDVHNK